MIAGGLGGLGRAIVEWLHARGARHIVILSRSGKESSHASKLLEFASSSGFQLLIESCDIRDSAALIEVLRVLKQQCPPIKGCINAAMVINVS